MSGVVSYELLSSKVPSDSGWTADGGLYITLINNTGTASVKGTVVSASTTIDNGVDIAPADSDMPIGAIAENGIANGSPVKVTVSGKAYVLIKDGLVSTRGYWCGMSDTAGRMYEAAVVPAATNHFREIGHSLQSAAAGASVLILIDMHFN